MVSLSHILLVLLVVLIVFGAGKLPEVMAEIGKGLKNFRQNLKDENQEEKKLEHKKEENKGE